MRIVTTRSIGGHELGAELDLPDGQAAILIANGVAEEVKSKRAAKRSGAAAPDAQAHASEK